MSRIQCWCGETTGDSCWGHENLLRRKLQPTAFRVILFSVQIPRCTALRMRRIISATVVGILFLAVAAPAALASIPSHPLRPCCMRGSHHACQHSVRDPENRNTLSGTCACDDCERTLVSQPATPRTGAAPAGAVPQFTFLDEFYAWPLPQAASAIQAQRAPPLASLQRVRSIGSRITSKLHRLTAAVWPL